MECVFADNSDEGTNIYLDLILGQSPAEGFPRVIPVKPQNHRLWCIENWVSLFIQRECAGSESLIRSSRSGETLMNFRDFLEEARRWARVQAGT